MNKSDGGPAFPAVAPHFTSDEGWMPAVPGMSLRDYFAAKAMQGWLASWPEQSNTLAGNKEGQAATAAFVYEIADAMLAEREKDDGA